MKDRYKSIFFLCCLLCGAHINAQSYLYKHFTVEDGLPSNTVYCVYQDHKGYLWFGTDMGISRYNGLGFENFTTADGLADNEVFSFKEDFYGRLWMATYNGKLCYYKNGRFHSDKNDKMLQLPFKPFYTTLINLEQDSTITILYANKHDLLNIDKNYVKVFSLKGDINLNADSIISVRKDNSGVFEFLYNDRFITTDNKLKIKSIKKYKQQKKIISVFGGDKNYLLSGDSAYLNDQFIFTDSMIDIKKYFNVNNTSIYCIYYKNGKKIFCTRDGLLFYNKDRLLQGKIFTCITDDFDGNYWATTYKNGIYLINRSYDDLKIYKNAYVPKIIHCQSYKNKLLFYTSKDNKLFSFGSQGTEIVKSELGYKRSDVETIRWFTFLVGDSGIIYFTLDSCTKMYVLVNKNTFLSCYNMYRSIWTIFFNNGYIYGFDNYQIAKFSYEKCIKGQKSSPTIIYHSTSPDGRIFGKAMDNEKKIWFSTNQALYKLENDIPQAQLEFKNIVFRKFNFYAGYLIGYDNKNVLYVCKKSHNNYTIDTVKTNSNYIWGSIYPLDSLHLLLSTNRYYQLLTLNPLGKTLNYSIKPIERSFIPLNAEYVFADTTNCYFFKDGDVTSVNLRLLVSSSPAPRVLFTHIGTIKGDYAVSPLIIIGSKEARNIAVDFTALSFNSKEINYEYSITSDSMLADWHKTNSNTISFASLGYGKYFIKIRAKSIASNYSSISTLQLIVLKPFYLTWIFLAAVAALFISLLIIIVRVIIRRILLKRKKEYDSNMRYYGAEYKALNALMNPHFIFNSLNNIQGLINRNDKKAANKFLMNFSKLVRQNMQNVSKGTVSLQEELDLIKNYLFLEKMRFDDFVDYTFEIDDQVETELIQIPPLLIQPLVENSIKHGLLPKQDKNGMVTIRVYEHKNDVYIDVIDNGVGFNYQKQIIDSKHESFGLENLNKRTAYAQMLHKQNITFSIREIKNEDGTIAGTIATLKIDGVPVDSTS